jgi:hypothetical protein
MARVILILISLGLIAPASGAQKLPRPPVIDMHAHIDAGKGPAIMDSLNVRFWLITGGVQRLREWATLDAMRNRYLPSLSFCPFGQDVIFGVNCYEPRQATHLFPDVSWLRQEVQEGRIKAFGEMLPQFVGIAPNDKRLERYWALAEDLDIPAAIHMGPGPPGAAYESSPVPKKNPEFRMAQGDPLLLEEVLLRHKRLRLSVMHAGWPRTESMLALLYAHPNVYVDTGGLQSGRIVPRAGYYRHLQALVDNGFGKRIMFASDFPDQISEGIDAILAAGFLTDAQRADILCHNAARFFRLNAAICAR